MSRASGPSSTDGKSLEPNEPDAPPRAAEEFANPTPASQYLISRDSSFTAREPVWFVRPVHKLAVEMVVLQAFYAKGLGHGIGP
jgi:hypothetical protein